MPKIFNACFEIFSRTIRDVLLGEVLGEYAAMISD